MKKTLVARVCWFCALAAAGFAFPYPAAAQDAEEKVIETRVKKVPAESLGSDAENREARVLIQKVERDGPEATESREVPWLGVATEETSEALASQLGLNAGEGLIVTFVATDGPAAKAGLQKNDVLVEFEGQLLVHPTQLRKLIQMHKEGDEVTIAFYRAGKKESVKATIGKTNRGMGLLRDERSLNGELQDLHRELRDLHLGQAAREQLNSLRQSLQHAGVDREAITKEVRRSMEEVRKALQEAMRQVTNAHRTFGPAAREFQELARRGLDVEKDATVVVKSKRNSVQSMVKTDDTGTYVIIADPKKRLTAHDKSGKLLFDGPIETAEQQEKVPKAVWDKVEPMVGQLKGEKPDEPKGGENSAEQ